MLNDLIVFHALQEDPIIRCMNDLTKHPDDKSLYYQVIRHLSSLQVSFKAHVYQKMILIEHPVISNILFARETEVDMHCIKHDLGIISKWFHVEIDQALQLNPDGYHLMKSVFDGQCQGILQAYGDMLTTVANKGISLGYEAYKDLVLTYGNGVYALYEAFYLGDDRQLKPIKTYDYKKWSDIYGYTLQKERLDMNTKAFVEGHPFHHALLVGSSGTGKSTSVKALIHKYGDRRLRLIQLDKKQLRYLPDVLQKIEKSCFRFILFMDDLSFEVNEDDYKFVKSFIEGGVKKEAQNVAFYVTSNRRHLIKEIRSERENDIHLNDFIAEMTSLSDRFGLTLHYEAPAQTLYFEMVEQMLQHQGITYDQEAVLIQARQWSLRHGGMSGRVAEQFVRHVQMSQEMA